MKTSQRGPVQRPCGNRVCHAQVNEQINFVPIPRFYHPVPLPILLRHTLQFAFGVDPIFAAILLLWTIVQTVCGYFYFRVFLFKSVYAVGAVFGIVAFPAFAITVFVLPASFLFVFAVAASVFPVLAFLFCFAFVFAFVATTIIVFFAAAIFVVLLLLWNIARGDEVKDGPVLLVAGDDLIYLAL